MLNDPDPPRPPTLDYAAAPSHWSRWRRRLIQPMLGITLLATGIVAWRWGPAAWRHLQVLYWQRQCLHYAPSSDTVILEEDPAEARALLGRPSYAPAQVVRISGGMGSTTAPSTGAAAYCPDSLQQFLRMSNLSLYPRTPLSSRYYTYPTHTAIAFMGLLKSPSGKRQLVVVICSIQMMPGQRSGGSIYFGSMAFDPATALKPASVIHPVDGGMSPAGLQGNVWGRSSTARVFAGQIDPQDPSRFTIRYHSTGPNGVFKGRIIGMLGEKGLELKPEAE